MWVCASTPPGMTSRPFAEISSSPAPSPGATARTTPPVMPTSADRTPSAVTTVPPRTTVSKSGIGGGRF